MKIFILILILINSLTFAGCSIAESSSKPISVGNSRLNHSPQVEQNKLPPCPDTPNCINTEYSDKVNQYQLPLSFPEEKSGQIISLVKEIIINMGGEIIEQNHAIKNNVINNSDHLHAIFTSSFFKFIDDFEIRIDNITHKLHIRSASRTGYSDFGVNKRRVKNFSKLFIQALYLG